MYHKQLDVRCRRLPPASSFVHTVGAALVTLSLGCGDMASPDAESDIAPIRGRRVNGVETIPEPVMPTYRGKGIGELLHDARRGPLVAISVAADGDPRSGEFVHPDLMLDGARVALMYTNYPVTSSAERTYDFRAENPSMVTSTDWHLWRPPGGLRNPVFPPPLAGYNSDGTLLADPARKVLLGFNREVSSRGGDEELNIIEYRRSRDGGASWGRSIKTLTVPAHRAVSPDLLPDGNRYAMWVVNAGADGCRARGSTIERYAGTPHGADVDSISWSAPQRVDWVQPGWTHWHIDVARMGDWYFGLSAAYPNGTNCTQIELFAAMSRDGVHWKTLSEPIERLRDVSPTTVSLYRATSAYDARTQALTIAYSAASGPVFAWENFRRTYDGAAIVALFKEFGTTSARATTTAPASAREVVHDGAYRAFVRRSIKRPH